MEKCKHKDGDIVSFFGKPVDPCLYLDDVIFENITVIVSKCVRCGTPTYRYMKQPNTKRIPVFEEEETE